jgi:hypothetical protein
MEPGLELEHRSHLVQVVPSNAEDLEMTPTAIDGEEKKKPTRIEKEHHKQALAFYYSLGKDRTLAKVAEVFGVKESLVLNWSSAFGWKDRVAELENRSKEEEFKEKAMELLNLVLDSMSKREEETGKLILTSAEKVTVEKLKLCVDAFKRLRDDSREGEPESGPENNDSGSRKAGPPKGVRVNVIIKK